MDTSKLMKPYSIRLTSDQHRAIEALKLSSFNKTKFIRLAIEEKLKRDFRNMMVKVNKGIIPF